MISSSNPLVVVSLFGAVLVLYRYGVLLHKRSLGSVRHSKLVRFYFGITTAGILGNSEVTFGLSTCYRNYLLHFLPLVANVFNRTPTSVGYEPAQDEPRGWLEPACLMSEASSSRLDLGKLGLSRLELNRDLVSIPRISLTTCNMSEGFGCYVHP